MGQNSESCLADSMACLVSQHSYGVVCSIAGRNVCRWQWPTASCTFSPLKPNVTTGFSVASLATLDVVVEVGIEPYRDASGAKR